MIYTCKNEQQWLDFRARGITEAARGVAITASDLALIMGNEIARENDAKHGSGAGLQGLADKKRAPQVVSNGNLSMRCGSMIEPLIVERFNEEHPDLIAIRPVNRFTIYERDGWMLATPDALVARKHIVTLSKFDWCETPDALLECKWTSYWMHDEAKLPKYLEYYQWQCRWQMAVTGVPKCFLRWILRYPKNGKEEGEHLFERDMEIEKQMIEKARCFHDMVVSGSPIDEGKVYAGF